MFPSCFITGTDTDAGKTVVTSSLLRYLARHGVSSAGLKPIASGFDYDDGVLKNQDIESIRDASDTQLPDELINVYGFEPAIAPHIAAQDENVTLSIDVIERAVESAKKKVDCIVVEGVGGWRVPLASCEADDAQPCSENVKDIASLAKRLNLPVILVVGLKLGCISHAILTAQAIISDGLPLLGWVANNVQPDFARKLDNMVALQHRIPAPLLFEVPYLQEDNELHSYVPQKIAI